MHTIGNVLLIIVILTWFVGMLVGFMPEYRQYQVLWWAFPAGWAAGAAIVHLIRGV